MIVWVITELGPSSDEGFVVDAQRFDHDGPLGTILRMKETLIAYWETDSAGGDVP